MVSTLEFICASTSLVDIVHLDLFLTKKDCVRKQREKRIAAQWVNKRTFKRYHPYHKRQMNV